MFRVTRNKDNAFIDLIFPLPVFPFCDNEERYLSEAELGFNYLIKDIDGIEDACGACEGLFTALACEEKERTVDGDVLSIFLFPRVIKEPIHEGIGMVNRAEKNVP